MANVFTKKTKDGIEWHVGQQGSGPHIVLIPSGEGDCASFTKIQGILAQEFTVTTFDMPGMSRSKAPASALENVSGKLLAGQVSILLQELSIDVATVYGCSSAGAATLAMAVYHPEQTRNAIVHEVPLQIPDGFLQLGKLDDLALKTACRHLFRNVMTEDGEAWDAMGPEYLARLDVNYLVWARNYGEGLEAKYTKEELTRRPIQWTIGAMTEAGLFFHNVVIATEAGLPIWPLPCRHFPQITIPDVLAKHIADATRKNL